MDSPNINWPGFQLDQEDLWERSREPVLFEREYFAFNHLYGGAEVLRQYADLPDGRPIPWTLQTIMTFTNRSEWERLGDDAKPIWRLKQSQMHGFLINEAYSTKLRQQGIDTITEIGSVFFYARELYRRKGLDTEVQRRGTIALPDKSDLGKLVDFDRESYAQKLAALPEEYHPVYVSMHWRDYASGNHEPYLKAGLKVVCSGHPNDPLFYQRLYDVCRRFKYSCSNEISTSFVLSVISGCQFFYLDGGLLSIRKSAVDEPVVGEQLANPGRRACMDASPFPPTAPTNAVQRKIAGEFAGEQFVRPPAFFRERWEKERNELSARLTTDDLSMEPAPPPMDFARWLPFGFDADGWADPVCGLEIPARQGFAGVEITLQIPKSHRENKESALTFTLDGDPGQSSVIAISKRELKIPIPFKEDGSRQYVLLTGLPPVTLGGELRQRSFRLMSVRWLKSLEPEAPAVAGKTTKAAPRKKKSLAAKILGLFGKK